MEIIWGIPFILEPNQTLTYIMSSHSTSLEPKSQLTISLALGRKQKKRKENSQLKEGEKTEKGRKKIPDQGSEEKQKKYAERSLDQTMSEQYKIVTK